MVGLADLIQPDIHLEIDMSRYKNKEKALNDKEMYEDLFEKRGVKSIIQYRTHSKKYVPLETLRNIETREYVWKWGDSLWRLSEEFYGDPRYWWVIASFNRKPTECEIKTGQKIYVPVYLADALQVVE